MRAGHYRSESLAVLAATSTPPSPDRRHQAPPRPVRSFADLQRSIIREQLALPVKPEVSERP